MRPLLVLLAALLLAPQAPRSLGASALPDDALRTVDGLAISPQDLTGTVTLLSFGYTACPDICPLTLVRVAEVLRALGPDRRRVRAVFVTLDPARDDWQRLRAYVAHFHPDIEPLRGTPEATRRFAEAFAVRFGVRAGGSAGRYLVDHSTETVLLDALGTVRVMVPFGLPGSHLVEVTEALLREGAD